MKKLAVHCTLYIENPVGDDPYCEAHEALNEIGANNAFFHGYEFDYDVDYAEVIEDE